MDFKMAQKRCLLAETKTENEQPLGDLANGTRRVPRHGSQSTSSELKQVVRQNSSILPLFEKQLSASDTDQNLGRLVLPKQGAEAYFPKVATPRGYPIVIQDTEGKEWRFQFRYWISGGYKTYILEGLKEFIALKQWEPGDVVTFHRIEPENKLIMGLRKTRLV